MAMSSAHSNHFASALSERVDTREAAAEACDRVLAQLPTSPSLTFAFFSSRHTLRAEALAEELRRRLGNGPIVGCSGESIVGRGREIEGTPALSLWSACFAQGTPDCFHLTFERTPDGGSFLGWPDKLLSDWPQGAAMIVLADPFSFPADYFLERINEDHAGTCVMGGMASGGEAPGECRLLLNEHAAGQGAVVVLLGAGSRMRSVVSQGCRPIGRPWVVTRAERNLMIELGGRPALTRLREVFDSLPNHEKALVQRGLHVGRVVSEYQEQFEQGDFLVRNVIGVDSDRGAIAIGDYIRVGQTVQFHVRDQHTADEEMRRLLSRAAAERPAAAALLFTCNGRGTRLFDQPHHDASVIRQTFGTIPLGGFFAQGEMGPVGGRNFLHGFTASVAIFDP